MCMDLPGEYSVLVALAPMHYIMSEGPQFRLNPQITPSDGPDDGSLTTNMPDTRCQGLWLPLGRTP